MRRTLLRALSTVVATVALLAGGVLAATPAAASPWTNVSIEHASGGCAEADFLTIERTRCVPTALQRWTFDGATGSSPHRVVNGGNGLCATAVETAYVQVRRCGTATTQQWRVVGPGDTVALRNVATGQCLVAPVLGPPTLRQGPCVQSQRWRLLQP